MSEKVPDTAEAEWIQLVKRMVGEIRYGTISIIVQDGKVVQVEENKKVRLRN